MRPELLPILPVPMGEPSHRGGWPPASGQTGTPVRNGNGGGSFGVAHNAVANTTTLDVVASVTNKEEFGALGLSSPQPQADADFTSTPSATPTAWCRMAWT